jgi:ribonucleoside-diphosphate reductase alpha chain
MTGTREGLTHKGSIGGVKFFLTINVFDNGQPGEIFLTFDQSGSTIDGLADAWATAVSFALQYGCPLSVIVKHFSFQQFDPQGLTDHEDIGFAKSVVDYVARFLNYTYLKQPLKDGKEQKE